MAYNLPSSFSKHERPSHHDRQSSRSDSSISSSSSDDEEIVALRRQLKMKKRKYKLQVARWEEREEKRLHHYKREARISAERVPEKEVEYLRKFLAKYRDEEDDSRWFEGRELKRRRRAFESEKRYDEEDRQAEAKELKAVNRLVLDKTTIESQSRTPEGCKQSKKDEEKLEDPKKIGAESSLSQTKTASYAQVFEGSTVFQPTLPKKIAVSIDVKTALKSKAAQVFNTADEEEVDLLRTRKTLKPFEITKEDRAAHITPEERSKMFKDILQKTPTDKKELFATSVDRTQMDEHFLDNRMRPWVMKRLSEYIGEEENSFCDYICDKIAKESDPYKLLTDVSLILDEDAETFMIKLWRKIVFETECKRLGVVSSPLD